MPTFLVVVGRVAKAVYVNVFEKDTYVAENVAFIQELYSLILVMSKMLATFSVRRATSRIWRVSAKATSVLKNSENEKNL